MNNTISLIYDGSTYHTSAEISVGCERSVIKAQVVVNGDENCNDFDIHVDSDWVSYRRVRNIVDLIIEPNGFDERYGFVEITYRLNPAVRFDMTIIQEMPDYHIKLAGNGVSDVEFSAILTDSDSEYRDITLDYSNGTAYISSIDEYAEKEIESEEVRVEYDNGLKTEWLNDKNLRITNYGKANLYYKNRYELKIKNKKAPFADGVTIKITYTEETDNFTFV